VSGGSPDPDPLSDIKEITTMQTRAIKQIRLSLALLVITALLVGTPALAAPQSAPQAAPASHVAAAPVAAPTLAAPVTINLCAEASTGLADGDLTMPDATVIPIWGFSNGGGDCADTSAIPSLPGPTLTVNEGDVVTVNLSNRLSENVSIAFHGQGLPADTVGAPPLGTTSYTFTASNPGTFLYEAGLTANGAKQVALGLYGVLIVEPATPATTYTSETVLVLSEIDPALNADPTNFNMLDYAPKYWLINGEAHPDTDVILAPAGQTMRMRYVNAGLIEHSMGLLGLDQTVIAKDGHARTAFRAVSETLAAGQTMDTLIDVPATVGAKYPLYDTGRRLDNNGTANGGMMTYLQIAVDAPPVVDAGLDQTTTLPASATLSGTVTDDGVSILTTTWSMFSGPGSVTFGNVNALGTTATFSTAGVYLLQLEADDGATTISDTVTITVNTAPTAVDDPDLANPTDYTIAQGGTLDTTLAAVPGVLNNDTDPDGPAALTAVLVAGPANASAFTLNSDGSFIYTHDGLGTTSDTFTYQAFDGAGNSNIATVTITITP
jgi:FtsP/CotA-like multicopper oxidase with cupredoxin domain